jgi:hypothetical protein
MDEIAREVERVRFIFQDWFRPRRAERELAEKISGFEG